MVAVARVLGMISWKLAGWRLVGTARQRLSCAASKGRSRRNRDPSTKWLLQGHNKPLACDI